jgi:hypothetical protein
MVEGRKRTWREIDKMRDGGTHGRKGKRDERSELERALENPRLKQLYLKEADRLFHGAKDKPKHSKDIMAIHEAYGTSKFDSVVEKYCGKYGLPDDWASLLLLLDLKKNPNIVCDAIDALCGLVEGKGTMERKGLKSKLRVMSLTARDPDVRETAEMRLADLL